MKCNRIICAVMLLIFVLSLYLPSYGIFAQDGEPSSVTIYEENFETGAFSTVDGMQGNNHTRTVTKSGVPEWTFEQYNGADISSWTGDIIYDNSATGDSSGIVNKSVILKSQAALSSTFLYHNLPQAYDTGIITVDISIRRPSNSTGVTMYFYEEPITSYAERTNPISQIWYESNSSGGSRAGYVNSYINSDSRSGTMWFDGSTWQTKKTWWQIRAIVNLDTKKTTVLYNNTNGGTLKTAVEGVNFMGIGAAGSYDMASSFGAIGFVAGSSSYSAGGSVLIDDIKITYEGEGNNHAQPPIASDVTVAGDPIVDGTLTGAYGSYFDPNGDPENGSTYEWVAAEDSSFTTGVAVLDSGAAAQGGTYIYTPTSEDVGKYIKFCVTPRNEAVEEGVGQTVSAALTMPVRQPQTIPVVVLTNPQNGARIRQGAKITLTADAVCDNTTINKIEYYSVNYDGKHEKIAESDTSPFNAEWVCDQPEDYRIYAKAYNVLGESGISAEAAISIYYQDSNIDPETGFEILYADDFETGTYSVQSGVETGGNQYRQVLKDGILQWTFAKTGSDQFSDTFPATATDFIADDTGNTGSASNGSNYLTLGGRQQDVIKAWHNFDKTITNGIVHMDIRINHAGVASADYPLSMSLYDAPFEGFASVPKKVFELRFTRVSAGQRIRYPWNWKSDTSRGDVQGVTCSNEPAAGQWIDFRIGVNLDSKKVDIKMKPYGATDYVPYNTSASDYKLEFFANSSSDSGSTTGNFTRASSVASLAFDGAGNGRMKPFSNYNLSIDDIKITHEPTVISFYKEDGVSAFDGILAGNKEVFARTMVSNGEAEPLSLVMLTAAYDDKDILLGVSASEVVTLEPGTATTMEAKLNVSDMMLSKAVMLKAFVWDSNNQSPHANYKEVPLTTDIIGDAELDIYILIGQSNMSGRADIASSESGIMERAYLLNGYNRWVAASQPLNKYSVLGDTSSQIKMGPGYTFATTLTGNLPDAKLGLVVNAKGGSAISQWQKGQFYYENTIAKAKEAQKYGRIKGILWHQGSSDTSRINVYMASLLQMVSDMRADLGDPTIPFIAGELANTSDSRIAFNEMLRTISSNVPYSSYASADGLVAFDGAHFDSTSQRKLGKRYAKEILRMVYGIEIEVD